MNQIVKIVKSLEESGLLIKSVSETTKDEAKEQKRGFIWMLLDTLSANLFRSILTGKSKIRTDEGTIRTGRMFNATWSFNKFVNTKNIIKTNVKLTVFIREIIYVK